MNVRVGEGSKVWESYQNAFSNLLGARMVFVNSAGFGISEGITLESIDSRFGMPEPEKGAGKSCWSQIQFTNEREVPFPFRGRSISVKVGAEPQPLSIASNERVLAICEKGPVWSFSMEGGLRNFKSAFRLPLLQGMDLLDVFNAERFVELLPLWHWLRELGESSDGAPLRACFIFDDPNLHWPRYGFVDFAEIAVRAHKSNYHVCFATIPLDSWFIHGRTARLFQENATRLSLCVHGNNHTKRELARNFTDTERVCLLRQAIRRIERLERKAGLKVCRVMCPLMARARRRCWVTFRRMVLKLHASLTGLCGHTIKTGSGPGALASGLRSACSDVRFCRDGR